MKRFLFKLQPLLKYREYLEQIAQQNTAKANMDVQNCKNHIKELNQTFHQEADIIDAIIVEGVTANEFKLYQQYIDSVENQIAEEKLKKIQLSKILKEKLLALKQKSIEKKAMEIYRERLKNEYTQKIIKIEQKELDEISSLKTARKSSNETL